jgi:FkbM family methyltransferase
MNAFDGIKWHYELLGFRGVCAEASFRLFGRPREFTVTPEGLTNRVYLRSSTSDLCAYRDVLIYKTKVYDAGIPNFSPTTIVDAGAHIGMASIGFAHAYPAARIVALEPEPANFNALVRNVSSYSNIVPIQAALWKEDGVVSLGQSTAHPKGAFQIVENGPTRVRAVTVRSLMRETGIPYIDLLKVDIEGAEKEVFESCDWIERVRVIAIELHDRITPGCRAAAQTAARGLQSCDRGEVTFYWNDHPRNGSDPQK